MAKKGPAEDVRRSIYSEWRSRGNISMVSGCQLGYTRRGGRGAHLSNLANTTKLSVSGGDAALCQITVTTKSHLAAQSIIR